MATRFTFPARNYRAARQPRSVRPARFSVERLESRVVLNGAQLPPVPQFATTLEFQVPAHVATKGVQFGFYGTGSNGQQYMRADYTFADVSTLTSNDLPLVTVVAGASQVASVTIPSGGTQYTTPPTVTFSQPPTGGVTATGTAVMSSGGVVTHITITNAGFGYTSAPTVSFSGGGGAGAAATAALGQTYTTTQTVTIPVPQVQNVSSALPFFVGAVASGVLPINSSLVATPTSSSAGDAVYGFFELNNSVGLNPQQVVVSSTLDVDVTTVDQFGIPFRVEFLQADGSPITTNYPYNQGVGTLAGLDRASIFEAFKAEHPTGNPWSASWAQGAYNAQGSIDPRGDLVRLVPTRSLLTDPAYAGQLGGLATYYDDVLGTFFDFYKTNDFVYWQGSQGGSGLNPAPNLGTVWSGRTVTVPGTYSTITAVDPGTTFNIEALQLTGQSGITGLTVTNNGAAGYASPPTVTIAAPPAGGVQATATVIMAGVVNQQGVGLSVAAIRIDNPGSGYTTVPTVTFTGGGPAPTTIAAATATVGQGGVSGINLTNDGTGYVSAPTVTIAAPDQANGVQATAVAVVDIISGMVTGITITNAGSGYTTQPLVSFTGGGAMGTPAAATAIINEFPGCVVNIYNPIAIQTNANSLPAWMTTGTTAVPNPNWNLFSPSSMVAAAAQAFASNAVDPGVNDPTTTTPNHTAGATQLGTALGEIENVIVSAFSRGIATMPSKTAFSNSDPSQRALLSPQQFLAGTSNAPISWTADPSGQNLSGGTLTAGTTYHYAVTTVDAAGNETVPTRTVQVTLTSQQNAARLHWSPTTLPLVAAFRVYRGTTPHNLQLVGQVANSLLTPPSGFTDGNPPPTNTGAPLPYQFYSAGQTYDAVSKFLHEQFINGLGYGFAFDDQGNFSSNVEFGANLAPPITRIVINDWGQAERFDITGPTTSVAGTSFLATVKAEVGDILTFSSSDPQAVLPASGAYNPAATSVPITLKTAGVQTVTLSDQTGRQAIFSVTVSPGQAAQLGFVGQPTFAYANRFMKTPVSVQVQDAFGNAVALGGSRVSLAFVSFNGATLLGQTTTNTAANGLATFPRTGPTTGLRVSKPGNYALTATSSPSAALTVARSQAFSISRLAKTTVVAPLRVTVNVPFVITVRGPDQYFQDTVTFRLNPAGNGRVVGADGVLQPFNGFKYTFTAADLGVKQFTLSLGRPIGVRTLAAYLFTAPHLSGSTTVTVTPASSRIRFAGLVRPGA